MMDRTMFYTGEIIRMCDCPRPDLEVYSDGRKKYAHCDNCSQTWELIEEEGEDL